MEIPLTNFEVATLNKVIHTHTFGEFHDLTISLHNLVGNEKDNLVQLGEVKEHDFHAFQEQAVHNILQFLIHNEFIGEREGEVHFLTHKGEELRKQGTLQKYLDWHANRDAALIEELHTIETRGYLDKDQVAVHEEIKQLKKEEERKPYTNYMPYYVLILVIIAILVWIGKSHFFN
jgi:hypothetical protein